MTEYQVNKSIEALIDKKGDFVSAYTSEDKQLMMQYSGYGGIESPDEISREDIRKSFTEFYTPDLIIQKMWALAFKHAYKNGPVLEPACGIGAFMKYVPEGTEANGYEINKYSYIICKVLYPQFTFHHTNFELVFIENNTSIRGKLEKKKKYDLVIGNPPYGDFTGIYAGMGEKSYTHTKNLVEYFITRGLDLLNPNGLLIYIIGTEVQNGGVPWLQHGPGKAKEDIAYKAELLEAYRLPNGVFARTDVLSDIIVLRKI